MSEQTQAPSLAELADNVAFFSNALAQATADGQPSHLRADLAYELAVAELKHDMAKGGLLAPDMAWIEPRRYFDDEPIACAIHSHTWPGGLEKHTISPRTMRGEHTWGGWVLITRTSHGPAITLASDGMMSRGLHYLNWLAEQPGYSVD